MSQFEAKHIVRCCLIQLYGDLQPANAEPLAIEALAGAINSSFLDTICVPLYILGTFQSAEERVRIMTGIVQEKYDLIGLSCPQGTYEIALEALSAIYALPAPHVVLGHALPTSLPEIFLLPYPEVLIVRGWGESAIVALCRQILERHIQLKSVPGLTYLDKDGNRHDNPPDWTDAPTLATRINPGRYFARVEGSRGCHYNVCTFCSRPPLHSNQRPWMRISSVNVLSEIERLVEMGVTTFTFADEDFIGNDPDGAYDLACQLCKFPKLDFALSVRTDNIFVPGGSEEENRLRLQIFQTLRDAGLSLVFVGIESFASTQLRRFGKGTSPENHITAIHLLQNLDIELELGMILFDPLVTLDELRVNVQTLKNNGLWCYTGQLFSFLRPQVGTPYVKLLKQQGLLGELSVNTAEYTATYRDEKAASIAQYCKEWNKIHHHFYMALRNVNRSELGTGYFVNAMFRYRYLQLAILERLLENADEENSRGIHASHPWSRELATITQDLRYHLESLSYRTNIEDHLLNIICSA